MPKCAFVAELEVQKLKYACVLVIACTAILVTGLVSRADPILHVYTTLDGHGIYYDTATAQGLPAIEDNALIFTILDQTADNAWLIVETAPSLVSSGRVETTLHLYGLPRGEEVVVQDLDPTYSLYGSWFEHREGGAYLVLGGGAEEIAICLAEPGAPAAEHKAPVGETPRRGSLSGVPVESKQSTKGLQTLIELKLGSGSAEIDQGHTERFLPGGRLMYGVPAFAVAERRIYIVDALNFRVLVYTPVGELTQAINYPATDRHGAPNIIKDISVAADIIYLAATDVVYGFDADRGEIVEIIDGRDTDEGQFGYIGRVAMDNQGRLRIADLETNSLYIYGPATGRMEYIRTLPYTGEDQLLTDTDGNSYQVETSRDTVTVREQGGRLVTDLLLALPAGHGELIAIDRDNTLYVQIFESVEVGAQLHDNSYLVIIQDNGTILDELPVPTWPGGPMTRYVVVDPEGIIYVGEYDCAGGEIRTEPPARFRISVFE